MFKALRDVPFRKIPRLSTGISELDWIYGGEANNWGLPKGKISLWSGPSGTGKSRSLIKVARNMSSMGHRVMYFQNEVTLNDFRAWVGQGSLPPTFYGSESTALDEQISDIVQSKADLVIVDSVNQINEFGNGHKAAIKHIYDEYRKLTKKTGVHVIFICQLDKQNMIKGGSELLFLADISMDLGYHMVDKQKVDAHFTISVGSKHRYGKMGDMMTTVWMHSTDGAECISRNRRMDNDWCVANRVGLIQSTQKGVEVKAPKGHKAEAIYDAISGSYFFLPKKVG
jgi:predicted ATP-dependent serine protease